MSRFLRLIVILLVVLLTGCTTGNVVQNSNTIGQSEPVEFDLHDVLISVNETREEGNNKITANYEIYYDSEARAIAEKGSEIKNSNKDYFERYFKYDDSNNLVEKLHYYVGYMSYALSSYTYIDDLLLVEDKYEYTYKTDEERFYRNEYTYDNNGNLIKKYYYLGKESNDYSEKYIYDGDLLIEEIDYVGDYENKGVESERIRFEYDENNNLSKEYYDDKLKYLYYYENDLLVKEEMPYKDSSSTILYEYDQKNRLIKVDWYNKKNDGTISFRKVTEYVYGDTNISDNLEYPVLEKNHKTMPFTNKYGTPTTICAHKGCNEYIASSGDTNCCVQHSKRCLKCNCYIDEDAMYCMDCLKKYFGG